MNSDTTAQIEGMTERHVFAQLHGVPKDHRTVYLSALAHELVKELSKTEVFEFTTLMHLINQHR